MRATTRRRTVVALLVLIVAALVAAAATPAVARAATAVRLSLDPGGGPVGSTVTAHGVGFTPGETVDLRWDTFVWATTTVDSHGSASVRFTVPGTAPGVHQVWMTGRTGGRTAGTPFAVREDWAQVGGGPGHGGSAVHAPDLDRFGLDWSWELGDDAGPGLGAVVADGMVYATTAEGDVSSLTTRGVFRWEHDLGKPVAGAPVVAGDRLVVVLRTGVVQGLDVMTGATRWSTSLHAGSSVGPVTDDGHAFVGLDDGRVVALDTETGATTWTAAGTGAVTTIPTVAGRSVVVAHGSTVAAVDAATGASRWSTDVGGSGVTGTVAWSALANRVIAVSPGVGMVALHGGTGAVVWTVAGVSSPFAPTVPGGLVYAERETRDGTVVAAVGAAKGNVLRPGQPVTTTPSTGGMTLVGSTTGYLFSFTAGGALQALAPSLPSDHVVWSQQVGASVAPIAAADGAVYVVTDAGVLMRFAG